VADQEANPPGAGQTRGMGRGLAAILSGSASLPEAGLRQIPTGSIEPNSRQPRRFFDKEGIASLAESIRSRGILQPLVVRPLGGENYELIAGERRLKAAQLLELERVPAIVRQAEGAERLELALIENLERQDLNPIDVARGFATLVDDLGVTKEEVGRRLNRSRSSVSNLIRLLDLPDSVIELIEHGELTERHGRALLRCTGHSRREELAELAIERNWTVELTERRAEEAESGGKTITLHPDEEDAMAAAEDALTAAHGREVRVRRRRSRYIAELELENPREGIKLAEEILRRRAA
jgi:ParB family transcriptional regulator, chromosome partitioning protein